MDKLNQFCNDNNLINPKTINFEEIQIDDKIKYFIKTINKSNWIYTLYSCQGHKNKTTPYFIFIVDNNKIKEIKTLLKNTIPENIITKDTIRINKIHTGKYYSTIATHWTTEYIDNETFYQKLNQMAEHIISK